LGGPHWTQGFSICKFKFEEGILINAQNAINTHDPALEKGFFNLQILNLKKAF